MKKLALFPLPLYLLYRGQLNKSLSFVWGGELAELSFYQA